MLVSVIDPRNRHTHTDSVHRVVALGLLCVFVEEGGSGIGKWVDIGRAAKVRAANRPAVPRKPAVAPPEEREETEEPERGRSREVKPVHSELEIHLVVPQVAMSNEAVSEAGEELQMDHEEPPPYDEEDAVHLPALQLISDDLPRFLFYLLRTDHLTFAAPPTPVHLTVLQLTLRCLAGLFATSREELKCQYEWMVGSVMSRGDQGVVAWDFEGTPDKPADGVAKLHATFPVTGEVRELLLESLLQFARRPSFAAELWINFDGDFGSPGHLFEETVKFLCRHGFPDITPGGPVTTPIHQTLCLDGLLLFLKHMVERRGDPRRESISGGELPSAEELKANKTRKRTLAEGAELFNSNAKAGMKFLQEQGFIPTPPDPVSVAKFLLTTPGVSKKLMGDYISKPSNVEILKAFIVQYDFRGKRIDEALRTMLESFRLPGEAQQIERIMENFAEHYFSAHQADGTGEIENQDAAFVLAFSVIMLNTDQHNPQVRRRMTLEDFQRNTRGVNNGKNFAPEYLGQIYEAIRERAIIMPEEHDGELGLNYAWKELLKRAAMNGNSMKMPTGATNAYDGDMLAAVWAPIVAAVSYAFDNAEDDTNLQKAVYGFYCLAVLSAHYGLTDLFDNVLASLARSTGLMRNSEFPVGEARREGTDRWVVDFGRNHKGQVAAVLMFGVASEYGNIIRAAWRPLLDCVGNLFLHQLLPSKLTEAEDFIKGLIPMPITPPPSQQRKQESRADRGGLFSALGSILALRSSQDDEREEPTAEDVQTDRLMQDVISNCHIEDIFAESRFLEEGSVKSLIQQAIQASIADPNASLSLPQVALLRADTPTSRLSSRSPAPRDRTQNPSPTKFAAPSSGTDSSAEKTNTSSSAPSPAKFNAAAAFFLDIMTNVVIQNRDRGKNLWPIVFEHIHSILSNPSSHPSALVERAVVSLLRLSIRVAHKEEMVEDVCRALELLRSLPQEVMNSVAEQMMAGILVLIKSSETTVTVDPAFTEPILSLLSVATLHPDAAKYAFDAVSILLSSEASSAASGTGMGVNPDNFGEFVDVLINFSAAAGIIFTQASQVEEHPAPSWSGRASPRSKAANPAHKWALSRNRLS